MFKDMLYMYFSDRCFYCSMQMKDHQRNPLVSFHALGLADKETIFNKWPLKSLNQIKEDLGHINVRNLASQFSFTY